MKKKMKNKQVINQNANTLHTISGVREIEREKKTEKLRKKLIV